MRSIGFLTIALAAAAIIGCDRNHKASDTSRADSAVGTSGQSDRNKVSRADKAFVHDMTIANMAEVELAKLAPERSTDNEVKKFAQLMIDDHTKSVDSLKAIAAQHNVPVPTELDGKHTRLREKIAKWHGSEFDRAYMDAMVDEHEDVLDTLESRVDEAKLAEYKAELADRLSGKKAVERAEVVAVIPEKSDNSLTMSLNEWAAATYPIVRAHLDAARVLKIAVDKRPRTTN
jgi:putative membrane protein